MEFRDGSSVTGRNILNIREEFGEDPRRITVRQFREQYRGVGVPLGEEWKLELLRDMLVDRQEMRELGEAGMELDDLNPFINILAEA